MGGTHMRVSALDPRGRRRDVTAPSPGLAGLPGALQGLWRRWRIERGDVRALAVASRGVWTAGERRRLAKRLRGLARWVAVMPDVEAAYLGALGDRAGVLLLAGTGSMALGRDARGRWARAGGWGPLLGDEGSAFWIGREWLRARMDRGGFAIARRALRSRDAVARIAAIAPRVLAEARAGSRDARRIAARSQQSLADLVLEAARALRLPAPVAVSWAGGLLADSRFRAGVWRAARRRGLRPALVAPRESPCAAVRRVAERSAAKTAQPAGARTAPPPRHRA
jgi:N-acetylmuramic acid 6-phosphate etherase